MLQGYSFQDVFVKDLAYLSALSDLTDHLTCRVFLSSEQQPDRSQFDGVLTAVIKIGGRDVGLVLNDFRVNGGSFGIANSHRMTRFFEYLVHRQLPAIYVGNSSGVRLMEGRSVFDYAFGILPALKRFTETNLFITCAVGKCIGLGAVVFGYGHMRIALRNSGKINLTGPEVFKLFFGFDGGFDQAACPERHFEKSYFVQEVIENKKDIFIRISDVLRFVHASPLPAVPLNGARCWMGEGFDGRLLTSSITETERLLALLGERYMEVFPDMSPIVRTFLMQKDGKLFGLFLNPPGHARNMINSDSLTRYIAALKLFRRIKIPIVSLLDSPGGDPRVIESDKNFIGLYVAVINEIIDYQYPKLGVVNGRCFGGATVLAFPKMFGSKRVLAVEHSQIGIMHAGIIDRLLNGVPRLAAQWEFVKGEQKADLSDLLKQGSIDRIVQRNQLGVEITNFLQECAPPSGLQFIDFPKERRLRGLRRPQIKAR